MHDPGRQAALRDERAAGGRAKATARRAERLVPATLRPVIDGLLTALDEVRDGTLPVARATAMASLASAIVRLYTVGVLEERVAALEMAPVETGETGGS